ncbi:MAG: hypothetical protein K0R63_844 [Rickettsiales bacterium]|jgi:predicted small secreted protein|nr:hypothetical protein [Rickettsiales bacterium]
MKKTVISIVSGLLVLMAISACNMWEGLGRDVQKVGGKMERSGARHN